MNSTHSLAGMVCLVAGITAPICAQTTAPAPPATPGTTTTTPSATATGGTPAAPGRPQPALKPFATLGGFSFSGYLRSRGEGYDYFDAANGTSRYGFTGHQLRISGVKTTPNLDVQLDLQHQLFTNLPDSAVFRPNPTTAVPLGQGGNYFLANGNQDGTLNIKQAFVRFKNNLGKGSAIRVGRFEFNDGTETVNPNPTLNFLKVQRLSQRLIGTFSFTHVGRAFDGAQISAPVANGNLTFVGARPTEGVFQLNANDNIDAVNFLYGAYTKSDKTADARVFALAYEDGRNASKSVKTDNRPLAARQADNDNIRVYTLGADYVRTVGEFDVLGWGALQTGSWGTLDHRGAAFALEGGYQPKGVKWRPWLRAGYYYASGDGDATDGKHGTFFTPLPTPRLYSRFPFYNQMNSKDLFAQFILRPTPKLNIRSEAHVLQLANANDLYYLGGGAFQDNGFGMAGRPSGGHKGLANVFDISFDYTLNPRSSVGLYVARALGKGAIANTFTQNKNATFGFIEYTTRF
ncbi:hypothetical protein EON83_10020 [bacterium]|nr:MAG: hypothetical protein EON83_10020 [bacterium]